MQILASSFQNDVSIPLLQQNQNQPRVDCPKIKIMPGLIYCTFEYVWRFIICVYLRPSQYRYDTYLKQVPHCLITNLSGCCFNTWMSKLKLGISLFIMVVQLIKFIILYRRYFDIILQWNDQNVISFYRTTPRTNIHINKYT